MLINIVLTAIWIVLSLSMLAPVSNIIRVGMFAKLIDERSSTRFKAAMAYLNSEDFQYETYRQKFSSCIDVGASYNKFRKSMPWDFNFQKMIVEENIYV